MLYNELVGLETAVNDFFNTNPEDYQARETIIQNNPLIKEKLSPYVVNLPDWAFEKHSEFQINIQDEKNKLIEKYIDTKSGHRRNSLLNYVLLGHEFDLDPRVSSKSEEITFKPSYDLLVSRFKNDRHFIEDVNLRMKDNLIRDFSEICDISFMVENNYPSRLKDGILPSVIAGFITGALIYTAAKISGSDNATIGSIIYGTISSAAYYSLLFGRRVESNLIITNAKIENTANQLKKVSDELKLYAKSTYTN